MNKMTELPAWERLLKRIVWKQLGEIEGKRILDFGSGEGITANYFAEKNEVFQNEYPPLRIKPNTDCHDRLIVLDYGEKTELVYHCGASSKDAGKKLCAINQITETAIIHPVIDKLLSLPDRQI